MLGRLQGIRRFEVGVLEEIAAHVRREEHDRGEDDEEHDDDHEILARVIRVKRDAVERLSAVVPVLLDLYPVRVAGTDFVQGHDVDHDEDHENQRHRDHVKGEEPVQRDVGDVEVPAYPFGDALADDRHGAEERHDDLRAPVGHVAPGQQVAEEGLRHQAQVDEHADEPDEFPRPLVRPVHEPAEHVQIDDDEERRGSGRVQIANEPAPVDVPHDVFDRRERFFRGRLVVHRQEDARDDLQDQHDGREHAEAVPEVEVLRGVIFGGVFPDELRHREARIDPRDERAEPSIHPTAHVRCRTRHLRDPRVGPDE